MAGIEEALRWTCTVSSLIIFISTGCIWLFIFLIFDHNSDFSIENNVLRHKADSPTDLQIQTSPPIKKAASSNLFSPVNGSAFTPSNQQSSVYNSEYFQVPPPPFLSTAHNWLPPASLPSSKDNNFTSDERKNTSDSEWNNIYVVSIA